MDYIKRYAMLKSIPAIPELSGIECITEYVPALKEDVLYPIIEENDVIVVAGAFFGDEGKGKVTDAVARHPSIRAVARVNSGENAGHTVYDEKTGKRFVFHLAPSGMLIPGMLNLIGPECEMDPVSFMKNEIAPLKEQHIDFQLVLGNVHIVTPYHKLMDLASNIGTNASTLKGMSAAHSAKITKKGVRLDHMFNGIDALVRNFQEDMDSYYGMLLRNRRDESRLVEICVEFNKRGAGVIPRHIIDFLKAQDKVEYLIELYKGTVKSPDFPCRGDVTRMIRDILNREGKILLEGPQSYYLSNKVETFWSSSTSADTSAAGIMAAAGYNLTRFRTAVINIHKFPGSSRVGRGANPSGFVPQSFFADRKVHRIGDLDGICEDFDSIQKQFFESIGENGIFKPCNYKDLDGQEYPVSAAMAIAASKQHNEQGATTLKPRVLSLFDCVLQHNAAEAQGPYLSISAMDRGDLYDKVGITVAYVIYSPKGPMDSKGKTYCTGTIIRPGDELPNEHVLEHAYPIIKVMNGWKYNPISADKRIPDDPLPAEVQEVLSTIEHFTGSKIISIGNGYRTKDLIYIRDRVYESQA